MITVQCDICGRRILNINCGICTHCYYRSEETKCDKCGEELKANEYFKQNGLCHGCYYISENEECETCGREITHFDWLDYDGECGYCHDGIELH